VNLDSLPGADECPFHDLPPEMTVWIRVDGVALPYSAERACVLYHDAVILEPIVQAAFGAVADAVDRLIPRGPIA
jgi:hypothetical protein